MFGDGEGDGGGYGLWQQGNVFFVGDFENKADCQYKKGVGDYPADYSQKNCQCVVAEFLELSVKGNCQCDCYRGHEIIDEICAFEVFGVGDFEQDENCYDDCAGDEKGRKKYEFCLFVEPD